LFFTIYPEQKKIQIKNNRVAITDDDDDRSTINFNKEKISHTRRLNNIVLFDISIFHSSILFFSNNKVDFMFYFLKKKTHLVCYFGLEFFFVLLFNLMIRSFTF